MTHKEINGLVAEEFLVVKHLRKYFPIEAGIFRTTVSAIVFRNAPFDVVGDAGVKCSIITTANVNAPLLEHRVL